ncbi:phosphoserine phosphatase SerB [Aliihoeflea sp. 40Bstr573]|uniref:phosphoserine phosphatase SerB n=1 Tax=Aliihoeflea sp. 40Bstr573 TaxID=2696467 RepID=UPI002094179A|nr:phosphoserine phosphatase SerB [Aliihoeflea sp. 40Bstr573]MCO6388106.1 phosphoserine phosphatase SerB [Aliihoeflea sp. 40Bstr573]
MSLIAVLISHPAERAVTVDLANRAAKAVSASAPVTWLDDAIACEFAIDADLQPDDALVLLRETVSGKPVDVAVLQPQNRRKRILIADMDSTMIDQECIDELADMVGIKDYVAAITSRAMNGEIAFEPALRERVALLRDLDVAVIDNVIAERITLASGGKTLVATMNASGAATALVSGGFESFTEKVAAKLGFAEHRANRLLVENGKLTGNVAEPILGKEAKAASLLELAARAGVTPQDVLAVGDGANDLDMIRIAGMGVALHAKPAVAAQAGVRIDHGDLTALLYLQGYRGSDFVA